MTAVKVAIWWCPDCLVGSPAGDWARVLPSEFTCPHCDEDVAPRDDAGLRLTVRELAKA